MSMINLVLQTGSDSLPVLVPSFFGVLLVCDILQWCKIFWVLLEVAGECYVLYFINDIMAILLTIFYYLRSYHRLTLRKIEFSNFFAELYSHSVLVEYEVASTDTN